MSAVERSADFLCRQDLALERGLDAVEARRHRRRAAYTDGETGAATGFVERDLCCCRDVGEVALAGADLVESNADTFVLPDGKTCLDDASGGWNRGRHRTEHEIGHRDVAAGAAFLDDDVAAQRCQNERNLGCGIRVGNGAADGAARAGRRVSDPNDCSGEER